MGRRIEPALVALRLRPGPAFAVACEAAWARGDAVLPLAPDLSDTEFARLRHLLRPSLLVDEAGEIPLEGGDRVEEGTALVVATSGSTGDPKGVQLTHRALRASAEGSLARIGSSTGDTWLCCLPLHHVAGLQVLRRARLCGTEPVILSRFDAEAVANAASTHVALVPTLLARLLDAGVDLSRLRHVLLGGAAAPPELVARAQAAGVAVTVTYGMTETCGGCVYDGVPLDGVDVRLVAGRVALRGPVLFSGYRHAPDLTAAAWRDGWFVTSDLGEFDADGRLVVLGRADDMIVTGGEKVAAAEVAALLAGHPQVAEAAVGARADAEWGQRVVVYVVPRDDTRPPTLEALRAHVRRQAPGFKAPREVVIVAALPRTGLGKVPRAGLGAPGGRPQAARPPEAGEA